MFQKIKDFINEFLDCFFIMLFCIIPIFFVSILANDNNVFGKLFLYFFSSIILIPMIIIAIIIFRNILYMIKKIKDLNRNIRNKTKYKMSELFSGKIFPNIVVYNIGVLLSLLIYSLLKNEILIFIVYIFYLIMTLMTLLFDFLDQKIEILPINLIFSLSVIPCKFHLFLNNGKWKNIMAISIKSWTSMILPIVVLIYFNEKIIWVNKFLAIFKFEFDPFIIILINICSLLFTYIMMDERRGVIIANIKYKNTINSPYSGPYRDDY